MLVAGNLILFGNKTNSKHVELTVITLSNMNENSAIGITRTLKWQFQTEWSMVSRHRQSDYKIKSNQITCKGNEKNLRYSMPY